MKRILVVGGLHSNEPLGIKLVQHLINHPCPGVTALLGNPRAVQSNVRYIEEDVNRIFPGKPIWDL
ncbi:MAG: hypothetical protein ACOYBJ_00155 [Patescibacteria group bacterium]|jgi:succinylglutamate desuccinylase